MACIRPRAASGESGSLGRNWLPLRLVLASWRGSKMVSSMRVRSNRESRARSSTDNIFFIRFSPCMTWTSGAYPSDRVGYLVTGQLGGRKPVEIAPFGQLAHGRHRVLVGE